MTVLSDWFNGYKYTENMGVEFRWCSFWAGGSSIELQDKIIIDVDGNIMQTDRL